MNGNVCPVISGLAQQAEENRKKSLPFEHTECYPIHPALHMPPWESLALLSLFTQTTSFPVCLDLREAFCLKKDSLKACGAVHKQQPNFGMKNSFLE